MERVTIVGCCGSGKTHLALQLAELINAPVMHLDVVHAETERGTTPDDAFAAAQRDLVRRPRWVVEGNYPSTLPLRLAASDTIVVLDLPAIACIRGLLQRRLRADRDQSCGARDSDQADLDGDLGVGSLAEMDGSFRWGNNSYLLNYRRSVLPRIRKMIAEHGPQAGVVELRSRRATNRFTIGARWGHTSLGETSVTE